MSQLSRIIKLATAGPGQPFQIFAKNLLDGFKFADEADATHITGGSANDFYPGGLTVADPYAAYPTWYVDAVAGADVGSPGNVKPAGWTYKTYGNALLDVFYVGNPGARRIIVKPTGNYLPWGTASSNTGAYFPAGGPDAAHPCVIQGDPSNSTLPVIDAQLAGSSLITGVDINTPSTGFTRIHLSDPISGPSRQPFAVGNIVIFANIVGTTQLNLTYGTVTATGGSANAWTVDVSINSNSFTAYVSGGIVWMGGNQPAVSGHTMFGIGNQGYFGGSAQNVSHIVIRKLEMANGIDPSIWIEGFGTYFPTDITVEYCYFHGNRYPYTNPGASGAWAQEFHGNGTSFNTIRYCKFADMGTRPDDASLWSLNCVPMETYGADNVTVQNCKFTGCYTAIALKTYQDGSVPSNDATQNNWTVTKNIFANCYSCINIGTTAFTYYKPSNNWVVTGNLVYGPVLAVTGGHNSIFLSVNGRVEPTLSAGTNNLVANNTFAEDCNRGLCWGGSTGITFRDNVSLVNATGTDTPRSHSGSVSGQGSSFYGTLDNAVFAQYDYNVYGNVANWDLDFTSVPYQSSYSYSSFAAWQTAYTVPVGPGAPSAPPDFAVTGNPDPHGIWIPNLSASYNTVAKNFPNAGSRDYTIAPGSPLLTASSTGGRVGYDPTNCGPGW